MNGKTLTLVPGINSVMARLQRRTGCRVLHLREGKLSPRLQEVLALAESARVRVERLGDRELDALCRLNHQGCVLGVDPAAFAPEENLHRLLEEPGDRLLLVLDGVTDPRNLGACIRSAVGFGVDAIVVPKDKSAPLNEAAIKTASGGADLVPVIRVVNLARTLDAMKQAGVWVVGTLLEDSDELARIDLKGRTALVLGAEGTGLRQNTIKHCDLLARIPMQNPDLGFNVSVAASICLYEARRQRSGR